MSDFIQYTMRLPRELADSLAAAATANGRSLSAEIVHRVTASPSELRQHYAGLAMQGLCSGPNMKTSLIPAMAVEIADALIAELAKPVTP